MYKRCERNRKRSKRRAIYCPIHECYLRSLSRKNFISVSRSKQIKHEIVERDDQPSISQLTTQKDSLTLKGEWLELFWCDQCQRSEWYHVKEINSNPLESHKPRTYQVTPASKEYLQQLKQLIIPNRNNFLFCKSAGVEKNENSEQNAQNFKSASFSKP